MIENFDAMAAAGMLFAILFIAVTLWFIATMGKKGVDFQQAKYLARINSAREEELRRIAVEATQAQHETAAALRRLESIEDRLVQVERMLREVDEPARVR